MPSPKPSRSQLEVVLARLKIDRAKGVESMAALDRRIAEVEGTLAAMPKDPA